MWETLKVSFPAPDVVACDSETGFERTRNRECRKQRHPSYACCQVRRYTTSKPKLQAGHKLYALAIELMHLETLRQAD